MELKKTIKDDELIAYVLVLKDGDRVSSKMPASAAREIISRSKESHAEKGGVLFDGTNWFPEYLFEAETKSAKKSTSTAKK